MNANTYPIYCFAPSGMLTELESVERARLFFAEHAYPLHNLECAQRVFQRFAGTDEERLQEIESLARLPAQLGPCIALALRGGYGLSRLLPKISWQALAQAVDAGLMIVGHSDLTALQIALFAQTGRRSYSGPMLNYDFGCERSDVSDFTWQNFQETLHNRNFTCTVAKEQVWLDGAEFQGEGVLWGGNLSMLTSLLNTSYFPDKSLINSGFLFIEDVNEQPYRIERMLLQLLQAEVLGCQQAIILGNFSNYQLSPQDNSYDFQACIAYLRSQIRARGLKTLILDQLPFGHCKDKLTIPIGQTCHIQAKSSGYTIQSL